MLKKIDTSSTNTLDQYVLDFGYSWANTDLSIKDRRLILKCDRNDTTYVRSLPLTLELLDELKEIDNLYEFGDQQAWGDTQNLIEARTHEEDERIIKTSGWWIRSFEETVESYSKAELKEILKDFESFLEHFEMFCELEKQEGTTQWDECPSQERLHELWEELRTDAEITKY